MATLKVEKLDLISGTVRSDGEMYKTYYFGASKDAKSVYIDMDLQTYINDWYSLRKKHKLSTDLYYLERNSTIYVYYFSSRADALKEFQINGKEFVIKKEKHKLRAKLQ